METNRNHFDGRGNNTIRFLVMHYTVCNFTNTMNLFTKDVDNNRVSAHYVVTQEEKDLRIEGGKIFQLVPDDKRSWHAGISAWGPNSNKTQNLNASSIGI